MEYELKVAAGRSREDDTVEFNGEEDPTLTIPHYNSATSMDEIKEQNEKHEQKDADASEDRSGDCIIYDRCNRLGLIHLKLNSLRAIYLIPLLQSS